MIPQYRTLKVKLPKYRMKKNPIPPYRKLPMSPSLILRKTADIPRRHRLFPREMTSEKRAQKFHTGDVTLPRSG